MDNLGLFPKPPFRKKKEYQHLHSHLPSLKVPVFIHYNHDMASGLASRIALITGAASGLGRATAERFVKHGARVIIGDLPSTNGEAVAKEIGARFAPLDVTSAEDVRSCRTYAQREYCI